MGCTQALKRKMTHPVLGLKLFLLALLVPSCAPKSSEACSGFDEKMAEPKAQFCTEVCADPLLGLVRTVDINCYLVSAESSGWVPSSCGHDQSWEGQPGNKLVWVWSLFSHATCITRGCQVTFRKSLTLALEAGWISSTHRSSLNFPGKNLFLLPCKVPTSILHLEK